MAGGPPGSGEGDGSEEPPQPASTAADTPTRSRVPGRIEGDDIAVRGQTGAPYFTSSEVNVAPAIRGRVANTLTTFRVAVSIHTVCCPGSPSADEISTFHALKVPAGTETSSTLATFACLRVGFAACTSKLRNVVV